MPDGAIVLPDTAAAPKDYTLSGAQEIALKTVRALIDGTGAATPFLPTLQLLDPNGHVMWEGATTNTVAAGGSADVSWFPGLGVGSGGAATGTAATMVAVTLTGQPDTTITAGTTSTMRWDAFATDTSGVFSVPGAASTTWHIQTDGMYLVSMLLLPNPSWPTLADGEIRFSVQAPIDTFVYGAWNSYQPGSAEAGFFGGIVSTFGTLPAPFNVQIQNESATTFGILHQNIGANGSALQMSSIGTFVAAP